MTNGFIGMPQATGSQNGFISAADWTSFNSKAGTAHPTFTGTVTADNLHLSTATPNTVVANDGSGFTSSVTPGTVNQVLTQTPSGPAFMDATTGPVTLQSDVTGTGTGTVNTTVVSAGGGAGTFTRGIELSGADNTYDSGSPDGGTTLKRIRTQYLGKSLKVGTVNLTSSPTNGVAANGSITVTGAQTNRRIAMGPDTVFAPTLLLGWEGAFDTGVFTGFSAAPGINSDVQRVVRDNTTGNHVYQTFSGLNGNITMREASSLLFNGSPNNGNIGDGGALNPLNIFVDGTIRSGFVQLTDSGWSGCINDGQCGVGQVGANRPLVYSVQGFFGNPTPEDLAQLEGGIPLVASGTGTAPAVFEETTGDSGSPTNTMVLLRDHFATVGTGGGTSIQLLDSANGYDYYGLYDAEIVDNTAGAIKGDLTLWAPDGTGMKQQARFSNDGVLHLYRGSLSIETAGQGVAIKTGLNSRLERNTLSAGTVVVGNTSVTANTDIFCSNIGASGTVGALSVAPNPGVGYTVNSTDGGDNSLVACQLVEEL